MGNSEDSLSKHEVHKSKVVVYKCVNFEQSSNKTCMNGKEVSVSEVDFCLTCLCKKAAEGLSAPSFKPKFAQAHETEVHVRIHHLNAQDGAVAHTALSHSSVLVQSSGAHER